jgi:hypothetical protein
MEDTQEALGFCAGVFICVITPWACASDAAGDNLAMYTWAVGLVILIAWAALAIPSREPTDKC